MNHLAVYKKLQTSLSRKLFTRAVRAGYQFRNQAHYGAFKRGYIAVIDGLSERTCPYIDSKKKPHGFAATVHGGCSATASHSGRQTQARTKSPFNCHRRRDPKAARPHSLYAHSNESSVADTGRYRGELGKRSRHAVESQKSMKMNRAHENETIRRCHVDAHNMPNSGFLAWHTGRLVTAGRNQDRLRNRAE